jgi:nucleoside-diphosphate-sugar epimerase
VDLLTGATGFLGHHLAARLGRDGRKLRAIVRPGTDLRRIPTEINEVVWGDITEPETLQRALTGIDVVFHTAARVSGGGSKDAFQRDNVAAVETLLRAAEAAGVRRFVHVSSAGIFGAGQKGTAIDERTPLDPQIESRGLYAWSKAESDRLVRAFAAQSKLETVVVRPGILYGGDAQPFLARLQFPVPRGKGRRIVVGSRKTLLPLTHVDNASDALALAAERGVSGSAYNVIDGPSHQGEYLDLLSAHGVSNVRPTFVPPFLLWPVAYGVELLGRLAKRNLPLTRYRLKRATESLSYDTSAAQSGLGWTPRVDLAAGVRGMAADGPSVR